jgi:BirA family biotin operon repressor/biotin-[acetyl-CoA-carboxylase] ligase
MAIFESPIIELDSIDSTNNYAMQLIDANKALQGMTIVAQNQFAGKGQRGKTWVDTAGKSLLMSVIVFPYTGIQEQFAFNASIAVVIANILQKLHAGWRSHIKWPNDLIINDRKAGGILIENVLRGSNWTHSVIGLGLNVNQDILPPDLPFAASLKLAGGKEFDIAALRDEIRLKVTEVAERPLPLDAVMSAYNKMLYKRGELQRFSKNGSPVELRIMNAHADGTLEVQEGDSITFYHHGQVVWEWE